MHHAVVIGAGSWGTTLACLLGGQGRRVTLVCRDPEQATRINAEHRNPSSFSTHLLPDNVVATADLEAALSGLATADGRSEPGCPLAYLVVPAAEIRALLETNAPAWADWQRCHRETGGPVLCNCSKGLQLSPSERTDVLLRRELPDMVLTHLSGPNLAAEIIAGQPAAAVAACDGSAAGMAAARLVQLQLSGERFRVYTGSDLVGVEVAGFYKNVIAIAAGMLEGLSLGGNARAALITRGLAEMGRLVEWFGGAPATLQGLAGVGDLIVTCSSPLSRNYQVGLRRSQGQQLPEILAGMSEVAEGVQASRAIEEWPAVHGGKKWPELPISRQVFRVLYEGVSPKEAIAELMRRPLKGE